MRSNTKGAILGLTGFAIFATHDVIVKYLGATYSPFQILFFSVMFGFPLISMMLVQDKRAETMRPKHPWWTALRAISMLVSSVCVFYAFSTLPLAQTFADRTSRAFSLTAKMLLRLRVFAATMDQPLQSAPPAQISPTGLPGTC